MPRLAAFLIVFVSVVSEAVQDKRILSATYGLAGCLGVNTRNISELEAKKCTVVRGKTSARTSLQLLPMCRKWITNADGMPITFSHAIPKGLRPNDIVVTRSDGKVAAPLCVLSNPANEANEMQTFAMVGHFGDGWTDTIYPMKVTIVGDVEFSDGSSGKGLEYAIPAYARFPQQRPWLVQADLLAFSTAGESEFPIPLGVYPNHCGHLYGAKNVTHRVRVVLNGGGTVDGVHSLLPHQTDAFQLLDSAGSPIVVPVVGLADLGSKSNGLTDDYVEDGDNFYDICLNANKAPVDNIARVRMPCEKSIPIFLPKGVTPCKDNWIGVGRGGRSEELWV